MSKYLCMSSYIEASHTQINEERYVMVEIGAFDVGSSNLDLSGIIASNKAIRLCSSKV